MKATDLLSVYTKTKNGRACVELRDMSRVGVGGFSARVTYYRDGSPVGDGRWTGDGLEAPVPLLASDGAESDAAVARLEREVRAALSRYD